MPGAASYTRSRSTYDTIGGIKTGDGCVRFTPASSLVQVRKTLCVFFSSEVFRSAVVLARGVIVLADCAAPVPRMAYTSLSTGKCCQLSPCTWNLLN